MEYRELKDLKKLHNNPRTIKNKEFKKLCLSIENNTEYFEARPIILSDRTGELVIIAGNQRYDAAKKIGLTKVPTHLISGLSEEREKEIVIRDNVSSGDWDYTIFKNSDDWNLKSLTDWGLDLVKLKTPDEKDIKIYKLFQLTIDCKDEKDLKDNFDKLTKLGFNVNILQI